ncbi:hypothetical protein KAX97_05125 [candidate division WOR-3 bacterium]|nr:hypothetical protein [candidate division WOR-3 bacterium]
MKKLLPTLATILLVLGLSTKEANAQQVRWHVHNSHNEIPGANCPVSAIRISPPDTAYRTTNANGRVTFFSNDFTPNLQIGENLIFEAKKDTNSLEYKTKTNWQVRNDRIDAPEGCLDNPLKQVQAHTLNIWSVIDTSNWTGETFYALAGLDKNASQICTSFVDPNPSLTHAYDVYDMNLENQDSTFTQGDSVWIKLLKTKNDTTLYTLIPFEIDTLEYINSQLIRSNGNSGSDTVLFPQNISVFKDVGLEEILLPDTVDSGTVVTPKVITRNYGTINQDPNFYCKINEFYQDSLQQIVSPGYDTIHFSPCTLNSVGNFVTSCSLALDGDVNPENDTLSKIIYVNPTGINENKQEKPKQSFQAYPTITNGNVKIYGTNTFSVYNSAGQRIDKEENNSGNYFINGPAGVYFLKPEDSKLPAKKIIKKRR